MHPCVYFAFVYRRISGKEDKLIICKIENYFYDCITDCKQIILRGFALWKFNESVSIYIFLVWRKSLSVEREKKH